MISMVQFQCDMAEGRSRPKKDGTENAGGFEELLARTKTRLSDENLSGTKTKSTNKKSGENAESDIPAAEKADEKEKTQTGIVLAAPIPPEFAAVQNIAPPPLPAQDVAIGTEEIPQRAALMEKTSPVCQSAISSLTAPSVQDGNAGELPGAPEESDPSPEFAAVLGGTKTAKPQTAARLTLSPQEKADSVNPQTSPPGEAIRVRGAGQAEQTGTASDAKDIISVAKAGDMTQSPEEGKKQAFETALNRSQFTQAPIDTKSTTPQRAFGQREETQSLQRSAQKVSKLQENPEYAKVAPTLKFNVPERVESSMSETAAPQLRQPMFEQVVREVTKTAEKMPAEGSCIFDMKLFPEGLGKLQVRMTCEGKNLALTVTAHSGETAKLLTGSVEKLRSALAENYQVTHLEVRTEISAQTQSSTSFLANGFGGSHHYARSGGEQTGFDGDDRDTGAAAIPEQRIQLGILDARV